jgi:hypothetical protein
MMNSEMKWDSEEEEEEAEAEEEEDEIEDSEVLSKSKEDMISLKI